MKKFVYFLAFVLIWGVFAQTAYARCDLVTAHKSSLFDSDDFLYLKREDAGSNLVYLKCDSAFTGIFDGSGNGDKHCLDGDLVFVTAGAFVGDTNNGVKAISYGGDDLIQCKTSLKNDRWENLGESGIKSLPKCKDTTAKSISTKTILSTGEEVEIACTTIRNSGGRKYCVGINAGDICTRTLPKKTKQNTEVPVASAPVQNNAETEKPKEAPAEQKPKKQSKESEVKPEPKKQAEEKPKPAPEKNKNVDEPSSDYVEKEYHCAEKVYAKQSAIDSNVKKAIAACHNNNGLGNKLGIIFHREKNIWEEQDDKTKTIRVWTMTNLFCDGNDKPGADGICPEQPNNTEATQQQPAKKTPAKPKPAPAKKNKPKNCEQGYELKGDKCVKKTDEKDEFKKMCTEFPEQIHKADGTITLSSTLTDDDTTCKLTSNGSVNANEFPKAINGALDGDKCTDAYYGKSSGGWVSMCSSVFTLIFSAEEITCDNANEKFDKEKGQCVATDSAGPEHPVEPDEAGTAPEETDDALIAEFKKDVNAVVEAFKTKAQKIKETLQPQGQQEAAQEEDQKS